jgi:hypothetical protein
MTELILLYGEFCAGRASASPLFGHIEKARSA